MTVVVCTGAVGVFPVGEPEPLSPQLRLRLVSAAMASSMEGLVSGDLVSFISIAAVAYDDKISERIRPDPSVDETPFVRPPLSS